jgi:hypothetical protein
MLHFNGRKNIREVLGLGVLAELEGVLAKPDRYLAFDSVLRFCVFHLSPQSSVCARTEWKQLHFASRDRRIVDNPKLTVIVP